MGAAPKILWALPPCPRISPRRPGISFLSLYQVFRLDRQPADTLARRAEDRVRHGGGDSGSAGLADSAGRIRARNDIRFNQRHLIHAKRFVIVEVGLLDSAAIDRDFSSQRSAQAIHDSALDLLYHDVGIYDVPAIDSANDAMHPDLSFIDRDLGDLRIEAAEIIDDGNTAIPSGRKRLAPARLLRSQLEHTQHTRSLREQLAAELDRILLRSNGQFVQKAFGEERIVRIADRPPVADRNPDSRGMVFHQNVRDGITNLSDSFHAGPVHTIAQTCEGR